MKRLLRTLILLAARLIGLPGALRAARQARKPVPASPRILLLRPDHLGDLILMTPTLQAMRTQAPNAHITMMVGPWSSEAVARHPAIDRLLTCPFPGFQRAAQKPLAPYVLLFRTAQQLQRGNYDLAINLRPDFWWGAALLYLARIPRRIGYAIAPGTPFLTQALPFQTPEHATMSALRLISAGVQSLGYQPLEEPYTPERYPLQFEPTMQEQQWVNERLQVADIAPESSLVVIHAGTGAAVKLWRTEAWAICATTLSTTQIFPTPVRIILTGSPSERPMLEEIAKKMTMAQLPLIITDATVGQLGALLKRVQLVLGVDNGPLHLAVAQDTPTAQIFGPTDVRIFGPWGKSERHAVIASTQRCPTCPAIPCGRLDFQPEELAQHPCVRVVTEQTMLDTITSMVQTQINTPTK